MRSLERQQDVDTVRRWIRARSIDLAIRSIEPGIRPDQDRELAALRDAVHDLLDDIEPRIEPGVVREIEGWLELRWERDGLERRISDARARLEKTFEQRSQCRVREWFAEDLPVAVCIGEPVPKVESQQEATVALAKTEQARVLAEAACVPRPPKVAQEALSDWPSDPTVMRDPERPLDPVVIDRQADEARKALARLPPAGPQPMWTVAPDIPFVYKWLERAWWVAAFAAIIATIVVLQGFVMHARASEDLGFWQRMQAGAAAAWLFVVGGFVAKRLADWWLKKKYAEWLARSVPIDRAHRAIGWQYVVRRAEVEQREAEADALRGIIDASARLRAFDGDPELGRQLVAVAERHAEFAAHVDAAAEDLRWAAAGAWSRR